MVIAIDSPRHQHDTVKRRRTRAVARPQEEYFMRKLNMFSALMVCVALNFTLLSCGNRGGRYEMVHVPSGSFQMGSDESLDYGARPPHTVTLSAFSIGKYEVTQALYKSVMGHNPSYFNGDTDSPRRPVEQVTWYDAVEFCNKLSERERRQPVYAINDRTPAKGYPIESATVTADWSKNGYRLPTEAQWEYAAKGGDGSPENYTYAGSDDPDEVAWYADNSDDTPHVVGTKAPNGLGLYDMSGNVYEWCWDQYGDYSSEAQTDPISASLWSNRVLRGGSWYNLAGRVRPAYRNNDYPAARGGDLGFRIVLP